MDRRQLLKGMLAAPIAHATISAPCLAAMQGSLPHVDPLKVNQQRFLTALDTNPDLIGVLGTDSDFSPRQLKVEGPLPKDLQGFFYRNGPARHQRAEQRYTHLFEGDGMIHQFQFAEGAVHHQGKFTQTSKFIAEEKAGRFLFSGPDSKLPNSLAINNPDSINTANTNVLPVNGELWALWEAGSATAIDGGTLKTKSLINLGEGTLHKNSLKGLPFSAHPKVEADGTIWNFGYALSGHIVLYQLNSHGKLQNVGMVNSGFTGGMVHDFLITEKHILLLLPSLKRDRTIEGQFSSIQFAPEQAMEVLIISKGTLKVVRKYSLDPGFVFHFGNAWEDKNGNISFDASLYPNGNVLNQMTAMMQGKSDIPVSPAKTVVFSLLRNGKVRSYTIDGISEFPRIYSALTGKKNRDLFTLSSIESDVWSDSVRRINLDNDSVDTFTYGKDYLVEEHVLTASNENARNDYLIGTALHIPTKRTCLNIFNAHNISAGPICRAWLPYAIPLGFHGNFLAS